jgi:hypothetical protein
MHLTNSKSWHEEWQHNASCAGSLQVALTSCASYLQPQIPQRPSQSKGRLRPLLDTSLALQVHDY